MDERDTRMVELLSMQIDFYKHTLTQARKLHEFARNVGRHKLATATLIAIEGVSELVDHFSLQQNAIMARNNAVKIKVTDGNKPDLKLAVNNGPVKINPKSIHKYNPLR